MGPLIDNLALQILALFALTYGGLWMIGFSVVLRLTMGFESDRTMLGIWHSRTFFAFGILIMIFGVIPLARAIMA